MSCDDDDESGEGNHHKWQRKIRVAKEKVRKNEFEEAASIYSCCIDELQVETATEPSDAPRVRLLLGQMYYRRARVLLRLGRAREAESDLDAALVLCPHVANIYIAKGAAQMKLDRYAEASETLLAGLKHAPTNSRARQRFDECLQGLRQRSASYRRASPRTEPSHALDHHQTTLPDALEYDATTTSGIYALGKHLRVASPVPVPPSQDKPESALVDSEISGAMDDARVWINVDDLVDEELEFWLGKGLDIPRDEVIDALQTVLAKYRPYLATVFADACLNRLSKEKKLPERTVVPEDEAADENLGRKKITTPNKSGCALDNPIDKKTAEAPEQGGALDPDASVCATRKVLETFSMSGSRFLRFLDDELCLLEKHIDKSCAVVALGKAIGAAEKHREQIKRRREVPFATEHDVRSPSPVAREKLKQKSPGEWADAIAPRTPTHKGVTFVRFVEIFCRLAAARFTPVVPEYVQQKCAEREQARIRWINAQAEIGRQLHEIESLGQEKSRDETPPLVRPRHQNTTSSSSSESDSKDSRGGGGGNLRPAPPRRPRRRRNSGVGTAPRQRRVKPPSEGSVSDADESETESLRSSRASRRGTNASTSTTSRRRRSSRRRRRKSSGTTRDAEDESPRRQQQQQQQQEKEQEPDTPHLLVNYVGDDKSPEPVALKMTLGEVREKTKIEFLHDRISYAFEHHIMTMPTASNIMVDFHVGTAPYDFADTYRSRLYRAYRNYAVSDVEKMRAANPKVDSEPLAAEPRMDIREFAFLFRHLNFLGPTLSLVDVVQIAATVCFFAGVPNYDLMTEVEFDIAFFFCVETKTFDGLVPTRERVSSFLSRDLFPALRKYTNVEISFLDEEEAEEEQQLA